MLQANVIEVLEAIQRRACVMGHDPVSLVDELEFDVQDSNLARRELERAAGLLASSAEIGS